MGNPKRNAVPYLITSSIAPLDHLEQRLLDCQDIIENWFESKWQQTPAPLSSSVDLRNAGFKLAPVDTNLFPAGFNNLNKEFMPLCFAAAKNVLEHSYPQAMKILLLPESHTRNPFYFASLATLQEILSGAGFEVRIGRIPDEHNSTRVIDLQDGKKLALEPLQRQGDKLHVDGFAPDLVWLNNDLSAGIPPILEGVTNIIRPPVDLGWSNRSKAVHFQYYQALSREFAQLIDIDPWLINPLFHRCSDLNFMTRQGEDCLVRHASALLEEIQRKYDEYEIKHHPFVVIKADAGTYGMGVMMIQDAAQIPKLNRKQRSRMAKTKGAKQLDRAILQEGVYTFETWGSSQATAEPVVYLFGQHVVGGFYRVHTQRGMMENLNAPGMQFEPLAFVDCCHQPDSTREPDAVPNRFYAYGTIARLAALAAAQELQVAGINLA